MNALGRYVVKCWVTSLVTSLLSWLVGSLVASLVCSLVSELLAPFKVSQSIYQLWAPCGEVRQRSICDQNILSYENFVFRRRIVMIAKTTCGCAYFALLLLGVRMYREG